MSEMHHLESTVLLTLKDGKSKSLTELITETHLPEASVSRAMLWLSSKGFVKIEEKKRMLISLGSEGEHFLKSGFPERVLVETIVKKGGSLPLDEVSSLSGLSREEVNIALGWARRKGWLQIVQNAGRTILLTLKIPEKGSDEKLIDALSISEFVENLDYGLDEGFKFLKGRPNVIKESEEIERLFSVTSPGRQALIGMVEISDEISQLTPDLIKSGKWRETKLRRYNIKAPVEEVWLGKKQPYLSFLDELKEKLVALGFKEMDGPIVEFMFFNCDALYMPQDHPAREIHDIYYVKHPTKGDLSTYIDLLRKVKLSHEKGWKTGSKGWGYKFSLEEAKKLVLRSQGTALSARMLINEQLEIPGKYFSIARCYRPDVVDRTHLTEFNQVEGIVVGENLDIRDLLGILGKFALEIAGAEKIRFRPDYFPFTEPSVELAAFKKGMGWIEFGGSGLFRPEMALPLGIKMPVIAWGLGVDRLFMMKSGITDIRELFTDNLEWLRNKMVI